MGGKGTGELARRGLLTGVLPLSRHGLPGVFRVRGAGETGSPVVLVFVLALGSRFDPLCTPTSLNEGRGRGTRWGELPTWAFAGLFSLSFWSFSRSGVAFVVFGVRSRSCLGGVAVAPC
jgi:hypothetical protein